MILKHSHYFFPDEWVSDMDSAQIDLPEGGQKLQGVPVYTIIEFFSKQNIPSTINMWSGETLSEFTWSDLQNDGNLRVYTIISDLGIEYVLAETSGNVLVYPLDKITLE